MMDLSVIYQNPWVQQDERVRVETSYGTHQNNTNRAPEKSAGCESAGTETAGKEDSLYFKKLNFAFSFNFSSYYPDCIVLLLSKTAY